MCQPVFSRCPRCDSFMEDGFAGKAIGLSFVSHEKFQQFAFTDEDISKAGWKKFLPAKAEFFDSYLCRSCELYLVDFSKALNRAPVEHVIQQRAK